MDTLLQHPSDMRKTFTAQFALYVVSSSNSDFGMPNLRRGYMLSHFSYFVGLVADETSLFGIVISLYEIRDNYFRKRPNSSQLLDTVLVRKEEVYGCKNGIVRIFPEKSAVFINSISRMGVVIHPWGKGPQSSQLFPIYASRKGTKKKASSAATHKTQRLHTGTAFYAICVRSSVQSFCASSGVQNYHYDNTYLSSMYHPPPSIHVSTRKAGRLRFPWVLRTVQANTCLIIPGFTAWHV